MRDILDPQDRWLGTPGGFLSSSNKMPVAIDDTVSVAQDSGAITIDVLANDFDPEGQPLTLISATASLGTAVAEADNTVTYTPPPGIAGVDAVLYEVSDDLGQLRSGQVTITITAPVLEVFTWVDNTLIIEAEAEPLALTIIQPSAWAGTYQVAVADLIGGPVNLAAPTVVGDFDIAQVLTAQHGLWIYGTTEGPLAQSWQWRANGADIAGATNAAYTVQTGDIGQVLSVVEIQTDAAGQREAEAVVAASQGFAPQLDSGLIGWWDASDAETITAPSGGVSNWIDKAGGNALTQTSTATRPTSGVRTLNGLNVLDFDGVQSLYDTARSLPASGDIAFHMVLEIDSTSNAFEAILSVNAAQDFQLDSAHVSRFDGQLNAAGIGATTPLVGGPFAGGLIVSLVFDRTGAATAEVYFANVLCGTMGYTAPLDPAVVLNVMANRSQNARVDGSVGELVLTSTLTNRSDYHTYLATKWGLV